MSGFLSGAATMLYGAHDDPGTTTHGTTAAVHEADGTVTAVTSAGAVVDEAMDEPEGRTLSDGSEPPGSGEDSATPPAPRANEQTSAGAGESLQRAATVSTQVATQALATVARPPSKTLPTAPPDAASLAKAEKHAKKDPVYRLLLAASPGVDVLALCKNCKQEGCPGGDACVFDSNVYASGKPLKCRACQVWYSIGDPVTRMLRGPYNGYSIHAACAVKFYAQNLKQHGDGGKCSLLYRQPQPSTVTFLDTCLAR